MVKKDQVQHAAAARRLAERLNRLFEEYRAPDGHKYTYGEVEVATGGRLSVPYLSTLCNGGIAHPRMDKLTLLADFFGVDLRYFTALDPDAPPVEASPEFSAELRRALANPWTRQFALRAADMGPDDYKALMVFWDYSAPLRKHRRRSNTAQTGEAPDAEATDGM